jgi:8-oxo-dGTP pyrophosphatase MutT (NUDIX family)
VIHALLRKVRASGWSVGGATKWSRIRKLQAHGENHADERNVLGAALDARESKCDVLAFVRDEDGDLARRDAVDRGIKRAEDDALAIVGGVAIPVLEGWILAVAGKTNADNATKAAAERELKERHGIDKDAEAMVALVDAADLAKLPAGAESLCAWLRRAESVLPREPVTADAD